MPDRAADELGGEELLERLAEIARRLAEAETLDETFQRVVELAEGAIENCDGATLMVVREGGKLVTPAFTSPRAQEADESQHATGEGPCLSAMREQATIVIEDFETEERWPRWRARVSELGFRSMVGLRLFVAEDTLGALDLYSERREGFDRHAQVLGQVLASHAAVAMKAAITEAGLERALASRDVIGQAKGIVMERERISSGHAFERLRELSSTHNLKLRELAQQIVETGKVPG